MALQALPLDPARFGAFKVVRENDPRGVDSRSHWTRSPLTAASNYRFRLMDRALLRMRFDNPIFALAFRSAGPILTTYVKSQFATEISNEGESDLFGFTTPLQGTMTFLRGGKSITGTTSSGLAYRFGPNMRTVTSDENVRNNVFVRVGQLEEALEHMLGERLRKPLEFRPFLDWSCGLTASLKFQLDFVMHEFQRPGGVADNAVALASTTDLLTTLILRGAQNNYSDQLAFGPATAVPVYVRRAEDFMRAHCAEPIRIADVAAAAGCSVRTLGDVFPRFRGKTPLAALHMIRLEQVHAELSQGANGDTVGTAARRYGFTNASRFNVAFGRHFGESPRDVVSRGGRIP